MNCTNKQQETAECEKRGCSGCFYNEKIADEMFGELGYTETGAEIYKTADEMFEELGYKKESKYYYHTEKEIRGTLKHIRFLRQTREFVVESNLRFSEEITMQELQAINKKVQELGWKG